MRQRTKNAILIALIVLVFSLIAILLLEMLEENEYDKRSVEYPIRYIDLIRIEAEQYELDPYLVLSIMRCESSLRPDAVSNRGAIGLMQIMPDTGKWIAHKLDEEPFHESQLYDPDTNVRFACWYIDFLERRFSGERIHVIAAYNAGHGSVEKWLKDARYAVDGKLTTIPFPETERYVEKVTTAYDAYRELYPTLFEASPSES